MEFLKYIWKNKIYRVILISLEIIVLAAVVIKLFFWDGLIVGPFLFLGVVIPAQLFFINSIVYRFHSEWTLLLKAYSGRLELREGVRVYVKNFWPWGVSVKNAFNSIDRPYYDFDNADILESKDLLIIYGLGNQFFGIRKQGTRPFAIRLTDREFADASLYQVKLISINETNDFKEITFTDDRFGTDNPITIRIYNNKNEWNRSSSVH